jgi:ketosteroid isomerase-like protein
MSTGGWSPMLPSGSLKEIRMRTSNNRSTDEAEIRDLVESWARAVRTKNLDGIMANHSPEILMFDVPPPVQSKGIEAYKKTWDVFYAWFQDSGVFDIRELNITAGDDVAFGTALMRCGGTEANQAKIELDFRLTICFRKIGGRWTVMHEHHSIPAS